MTTRAVVRHVRYWRGKLHRWSTVYQFVGTPTAALTNGDALAVLQADDAMCYKGYYHYMGTYECQLYNQASGGVPIATAQRFNWEDSASWVDPTGTGWTSSGGMTSSAGEVALLVEWPAGLSKTGKPVQLRKWYHAVPDVQPAPGTPDVSAGDATSLQAKASQITGVLGSKGLVLGSESGRLAGSPRVSSYFVTHQMTRGRRKKVDPKGNKALDSYIEGVVLEKLGQISAQ